MPPPLTPSMGVPLSRPSSTSSSQFHTPCDDTMQRPSYGPPPKRPTVFVAPRSSQSAGDRVDSLSAAVARSSLLLPPLSQASAQPPPLFPATLRDDEDEEEVLPMRASLPLTFEPAALDASDVVGRGSTRPSARASRSSSVVALPGGECSRKSSSRPATPNNAASRPACNCGRVPGTPGRHSGWCAAFQKDGATADVPAPVDPARLARLPGPTAPPTLTFTIDELQQLDVRICDVIPPSIRIQAASAFACALKWGPSYVLAFAPLCLAAASVGSMRNACLTFASGNLNVLFAERKHSATQATPAVPQARVPMDDGELASEVDPTTISHQTVVRAEGLVRRGLLARASRLLDCAKFAPHDLQTVAKLRDLHPSAPRVDLASFVPHQFAPIEVEEVRRVLSTMQRGSASGPSRLSRDHLHFLISTPGFGIAEQVTSFCNRALQRPSEYRQFFCARLVALEKKDGGVRPIAMGEALRRLIGRILSARHAESIGQALLKNGQVGVGIKNSAEALYLATATAAETMLPNAALVRFDMTNAFNCVSRVAIAKAVYATGKGDLWAYFVAAYGDTTALAFGQGSSRVSIPSEQGVQQGDPLGPMFFALALDSALAAARSAVALPLVGAFLDDVVIGGAQDDVAAFAKQFLSALSPIGLSHNPSKCETITPTGADIVPSLGFPATQAARCTFLGAPLTAGAHADQLVAKRVDEVGRKTKQFALLSPNLALLLARYCGAFPLLGYLSRLLGHRPEWAQADRHTVELVSALLGPVPSEREPLIHAPLRLGGLGLKRVGGLTPVAAQFASIAESARVSIVLQLTLTKESLWTRTAPHRATMEQAGVIKASDTLPERRIQKFLGKRIDELELASADAAVRQTAAQWTSPLAYAPLNPVFSLIGQEALPKLQATLWTRLRLGIPLCDDDGSSMQCIMCGKPCDRLGSHTLNCMANGDKYRWHKTILVKLHRLCGSALWSPSLEVHAFPSMPNLRADLAVPPGTYDPTCTTLLDVSITAGKVADRHREKMQKYQPHLSSGQILLPAVFSVRGEASPETLKFISAVGRGALTRGFVAGGRAAPSYLIGSALARCVAERLALQFAEANSACLWG